MRTLALLLGAVCWASPARVKSHAKPKAAPILLHLGDVVTLGAATYKVSVGSVFVLTPIPIPTPLPVPMPTPIPTPVPPGRTITVWGYRGGNRNPVNVFSPGQTVFIEGAGFGVPAGQVTVNGSVCPSFAWADNEVEIVAPPLNSFPPGPVVLTVTAADKRTWTSATGFSLVPLPGKVKVPQGE